MITFSPLRYPGGKTALRMLIKQYLIENGPINYFIEPYAGGAGLSLWLLFNDLVKKIFINDYDFLVYRIWDAILNDTDNFIRKIEQTPITLNEWFKQKEIIENEGEYNNRPPIDISFAAFFLNRCNRSGIITRDAGPIGGKKQTGNWKIDARYKKNILINKIVDIAARKENIILSNADAIEYIDNLTVIPSETLIYLDPPYYEIGSELYRNYYVDQDHIKLRDYISNMTEYRWILSYDNVKFIREIYKEQNILEITLNHQAHVQHSGNEVLITPRMNN